MRQSKSNKMRETTASLYLRLSRDDNLEGESYSIVNQKKLLIKEAIEVYQSEKIDGKTVQRLKIHYTCIGTLDIPDMDLIPENNVKIHTRQGVDVHFDTRACMAV